MVKTELAYPSHEHESRYVPPFPAAQTNIEPFPFRPYDLRVTEASIMKRKIKV
jgi:hypothetical protein